MEPIRILQVVTIMNRGGLETMLMNYYRTIDKDKIQFDFLVQREENGSYDEEIQYLGGHIYKIPSFNPLKHKKYLHAIDDFFKKNHKKYKIVHTHNNALGMYVLRSAKKYNIPVRIAHSHSSNYSIDYKVPFLLYAKNKLKNYTTDHFACGESAASWLFGNKANVRILKNAVNLNDFNYNEKYRREIRRKYDIQDKELVIGHVGRFNKSKNHNFIISVFKEILKTTNAKLLLVGSGDSEEKNIKELVKSLKIENKVIFAGTQTEVYKFLNAMDVFLFPSIHEGLPVTLIEAQANGLQCVISSSIPDECKITDLINFVSLKDNISNWADTVISKGKLKRKDTSEDIKQSGFEINNATTILEKFYLDKYKEVIK